MQDACTYLSTQLQMQQPQCCIVTFSFVNDDMRQVFRRNFPAARWVLIEASEQLAEARLTQRRGHFYKGAPKADVGVGRSAEWDFEPVGTAFEHTVIDGTLAVEDSARRVLDLVLDSP